MTTTRSYRHAMPVEDAVRELRSCAGAQFDPAVVEGLIAALGSAAAPAEAPRLAA